MLVGRQGRQALATAAAAAAMAAGVFAAATTTGAASGSGSSLPPPHSCPGRWELGWDYPVAASLRTHSLLFSVVCLYSILSVAFSPLSRKREISLTATYVHACGCLSYLFMGNAWVPFLHTHDGWPVLLARSLEWCLSVPLFLRMLAQLVADRGADADGQGHGGADGPDADTDADGDEQSQPQQQQQQHHRHAAPSAAASLGRDQRRQALALLLGTVVGPFLLPHPVAWLCYAAGCVLQAQVLHRIHVLLRAVRATVKDARDEALLAGVHATTLGLFCVYPVVWYLGVLTHAISPETEAQCFAWLDLVSKFAFTSVLCNLTTRTYDLDMVDSAAQFWKFIRVIELPVFAISKERRVIFWNRPMAELTQTGPRDVLHRRVEDLADVFPDDARASLAHMATASASSSSGAGSGLTATGGGGGGGGSKQDVRYEVPVLAGGRRGRVVKATFSVLANHLEEVAIPRVVFVGSHPAEPPHVFGAEPGQGQQRRRGGTASPTDPAGGGGVSSSEDSYSYSSSSSQSVPAAAAAAAGAGRGGRGRSSRSSGGLRSSSGGRVVAAGGGAPANVYGEGEGGSRAVGVGGGGSPVPGGADATAFVQLAYCLHSGAVGTGGGDSGEVGAGQEGEGRRKQE